MVVVVVGWVSTLVPRGAELEMMSHALKGAPSRESPQEQHTPNHRTQAPGANRSRSLSIARNKDKHCSSHSLHTRQPAAFVSNSNRRQLLTVWQLHILPAVGYKKHGHRVPGPWQGLFFTYLQNSKQSGILSAPFL